MYMHATHIQSSVDMKGNRECMQMHVHVHGYESKQSRTYLVSSSKESMHVRTSYQTYLQLGQIYVMYV